MIDSPSRTDEIQGWLDRMRAGDRAARSRVIEHLASRFLGIAGKMLHGFPGVQRWDRGSDVCQGAMLRLLVALEQVKPATVADLLRLAARQMRRELIDLARRYYGPEGLGANHASWGGCSSNNYPDAGTVSDDPADLAMWSEFHAKVEELPEKEREVFDLLWYQGLGQDEVAAMLQITDRTVRNRWVSARLLLRQALAIPVPAPDLS